MERLTCTMHITYGGITPTSKWIEKGWAFVKTKIAKSLLQNKGCGFSLKNCY